MLAPGESQTLTFTLTAKDLASYARTCSCWVVEAGSYNVNVGASSLDVKSSAKFAVLRDVIVEKARVSFAGFQDSQD
jgi:beta-glucosidase